MDTMTEHESSPTPNPATPPVKDIKRRSLARSSVFWGLSLLFVATSPVVLDPGSEPHPLPTLLGGLLVPWAVAWLAWRISRRSQIAVALAMLAVIGAQAVSTLYYRAAPRLSDDQTDFSTDYSEFCVTFPGKPSVEPVTLDNSQTGVANLTSMRAELPTENLYCRAEVAPTSPGMSESVTQDVAYQQMRLYAAANGLDILELRWEETALGPRAKLRGVKILNDGTRDRAVTWMLHTTWGTQSVVIVSIAGPAETFPPPGGIRFLESVRLKSDRDGPSAASPQFGQ